MLELEIYKTACNQGCLAAHGSHKSQLGLVASLDERPYLQLKRFVCIGMHAKDRS